MMKRLLTWGKPRDKVWPFAHKLTLRGKPRKGAGMSSKSRLLARGFPRIATAEERRDERRERRRIYADRLDSIRYKQELEAVRAAVDADSRLTFEQRGNRAFTPLTRKQLAVLERARRGYEGIGQLTVLDGDERVHNLLALLRLNLLTSQTVVSCADFRSFGRSLLTLTSASVLDQLAASTGDLTVVLPWRAA